VRTLRHLSEQQSRSENLSASLEHIEASAELGCEGCQLVAESIERLFREELRHELRSHTLWIVTPAWLKCASWRRGPGAISLAESEELDDPGHSVIDAYHGTIYMYCAPGVFKEGGKVSSCCEPWLCLRNDESIGQSPQSVDIPAQRHTCRDTSSGSARRLAKSWLDDCCLTYNECKYPQIPYLPKRTVFVGSNNSQIFLSEN
jgi:hypothetical protein